jgi:hypothetical protein
LNVSLACQFRRKQQKYEDKNRAFPIEQNTNRKDGENSDERHNKCSVLFSTLAKKKFKNKQDWLRPASSTAHNTKVLVEV